MPARRFITALVLVTTVAGLAAHATLAQTQTRARPVLSATHYFPLADGDRWTYARRGPGIDETWQVSAAMIPSPTIAERRISLSGYFFGPPRQVSADRLGNVFERDPFGGRDTLWYRLGAPVGTSWELRLVELPTEGPVGSCISGSKLVLAATHESVSVPAGQFRNVVRIDFTSPCADAGITSEWFAPSVGLIRRVESSFAGPIVSELVQAIVGGHPFPAAAYETALALGSPLAMHDLMPPVDESSLAFVRGAFTLANRTAAPLELVFTGCVSATVSVIDEDGRVVLTGRADDGGCCACDVLKRLVLVHDALVLPFSLVLKDAHGSPLADGWYGVEATLDVLDPQPLRPAARARIEIQSVY